MSGIEHFDRELRELDHQIQRCAAICGVNLANRHEIDACLNDHHLSWSEDRARESLCGLLVLRIKLEADMIAAGFSPPPLLPPLQPPAAIS
jgi:hypothetical protein